MTTHTLADAALLLSAITAFVGFAALADVAVDRLMNLLVRRHHRDGQDIG